MSTRTSRTPATANESRGAADDTLRAMRARRTAWALGLLAIAFYVGFMVWIAIQGPR